MTKDWDAVKGGKCVWVLRSSSKKVHGPYAYSSLSAEIEDLSWMQKKRLDEVRKIMEEKHGFKAS